MSPRQRAANPRGEGSRLRAEIMSATTRLLADKPVEAVTLRSIAREAGIAAPSIYPHFADRDAVLDAVVEQAFADLGAACALAADGAASGIDELRALCAAYLRFGHDRPGVYRVLFERAPANIGVDPRQYLEGQKAFGLLAAAIRRLIDEGSLESADPDADAQVIWAVLHGLVTLPQATPAFPWKSTSVLLELVLGSVGRRPSGSTLEVRRPDAG